MSPSVRFVEGEYKGLVFHRGTGPSERKTINGSVRIVNSTNFWYSPISIVSVSAEYLNKNKRLWVDAPSV